VRCIHEDQGTDGQLILAATKRAHLGGRVEKGLSALKSMFLPYNRKIFYSVFLAEKNKGTKGDAGGKVGESGKGKRGTANQAGRTRKRT